MPRLDIKFLCLAAFLLMIGVGMGIYMGASHDFSFSPIHAHVNLIGWTSLALFGVTYRIYPELQQNKMARVHFALAAPAALLFPIGIYLSIFMNQPLVTMVAAFAWIVGCLLFLIQLAGLLMAQSRLPMPAAAEASAR